MIPSTNKSKKGFEQGGQFLSRCMYVCVCLWKGKEKRKVILKHYENQLQICNKDDTFTIRINLVNPHEINVKERTHWEKGTTDPIING